MFNHFSVEHYSKEADAKKYWNHDGGLIEPKEKQNSQRALINFVFMRFSKHVMGRTAHQLAVSEK